MSKLLWFDCETGGLDPERHSILEIAGFIEIDRAVVEDFHYKVQPNFDKDDLSLNTVKAFGLNMDDIMTGEQPADVAKQLVRLFKQHVDPYDKADKMTPAGYNPEFDISFLRSFFYKTGEKFLFSYIEHAGLDVLALVRYLDAIGRIDGLADHKLTTVCEHFGIELDSAHTAMADITATWRLEGLLRAEFLKEA